MPYHRFVNEDGELYGSFQTFEVHAKRDQNETGLKPGWYWWTCFPGGMPESDPNGPFESEEAAVHNANEEGI